jgi:hypothetical protein
MPVSGELIRMINYVDDITTTLRRISSTLPLMTDDERKRLADHMRQAVTKFEQTIQRVESDK